MKAMTVKATQQNMTCQISGSVEATLARQFTAMATQRGVTVSALVRQCSRALVQNPGQWIK